ncbi:NgoPII family restriction endonuclease [Alkaliphilus oremlandii]|uniref:Type II site-specific deoxyribonuclease n=1 Tax=Alkaliphilus oremlandii (strain OhILAs) TaxID=350688 RepID=A8MHW4_ALKOO|nr:NgoPII family restriction endonuclease [Alkaliphilus oremlandii]ABW19396.1 Type II site-specific deoxyribonuclease [Alkaliphilus oremlandii OhILAs]
MSTNIIRAIINLVNTPVVELKEYADSHNRVNSMGGALEEYIKDIFAGTVGEIDEKKRLLKIQECFSYLGNQNNPPDSMLWGGDAIEVKKIESKDAQLALNSSYPKAKLFSNSKMIKKACRACEDWTVKDMIYTVGVVKDSKLSSLCMVYGIDYAADAETYEQIKEVIKDGVESINGVEFAETKELGRVNRVDPLGITYLRVRGMWGIENPFKVFNYVYERDSSKNFNFMALINNEKYDTLEYTDELEKLVGVKEGLELKEVNIKNPNNPANLRKAKLITFTI